MSERRVVMCGLVCLVTFSLFLGSSSAAINRESVQGAWLFDESGGSQVLDSSGKKHHGSLTADDIQRVEGMFGRALEFFGGGHVVVPHDDAFTTPTFTLMGWVKVHEIPSGWTMRLIAKDGWPNRNYGMYVTPASGVVHFAFCAPGQADVGNMNGNTVIADNEWHHVAMTYDLTVRRIYVDGKVDQEAGSTIVPSQNTVNVEIGTGPVGIMDEVLIATEAFTKEDIDNVMQRGLKKSLGIVAAVAGEPAPAAGATDVPRDAALNWTGGEMAAAHDVYLGTAFDDVNAAGTAAPGNVLVSQGQGSTTYTPESPLEYGRTYYWRVDEVNGAPDHTVFKGDVWSFTVEPYAYQVMNIGATASSSDKATNGPANTVNGSGLINGGHSTAGTDMWVTKFGAPGPAWIQYEFDRPYLLQEMYVWNYNIEFEQLLGYGFKDVTIEYSLSGTDWTLFGDVVFEQATSQAGYAPSAPIPLNNIYAKFVRLSPKSNYSLMGLTQYGLSEVQFFQVPVVAREPQPANGASGVALEPTLRWRPGRQAVSQKIYFSADRQGAAAGTVAAAPATGNSYQPGPLDYGRVYYWRVDEVNDAASPSVRQGDVWSFSTTESFAVDDFESYDDDLEAKTTIFDTWIDGVTDGQSNSTVGNFQAPFAEQTVIHSGKQSMPMDFDNSKVPFFSEASREFAPLQNWTVGGVTDLSLWVRGYPAAQSVAVTEAAGTITLSGDGTDIWNNSDQFTFAYKTLNGDGSMTARVVSIGPGSNTWAKAGVMIRASLTGGSAHAMMVMTANSDGAGGNGASFQYRLTTDGGSGNWDSTSAVKPPYYVRIERKANDISAFLSPDGKTWKTLGVPQTIEMAAPSYIGLCVTSHAAGEQREFVFDSITTTGGVTGAWQGAVIDSPRYNDRANLYVTVEDSAGKSATVSDAALVNAPDWTQWKIPLSSLTGVDLAKVKKLYLGVGDRTTAKADGTGKIYIDDIRVGAEAPITPVP